MDNRHNTGCRDFNLLSPATGCWDFIHNGVLFSISIAHPRLDTKLAL